MDSNVSTGENCASFQIVCRSVAEGLFLLGREAAFWSVKKQNYDSN
jgi:hypothetical protein